MYEYIITLDSECEIVKEVDLYSLCEQFYCNKILYGNDTFPNDTFFNVNIIYKICKRYFVNHKSFHKLNTTLYLWFNQLCIFKSEYLHEFFCVTNITKQYEMLTFWDFEYYIFMYYLILYKDFRIVDLEVIASSGALESNSFYPKYGSKKYLNEAFMVCHLALYPLLNKDKLFIIHHKDRISDERSYSSLEELQNSLPYKLGVLYKQCKGHYFNYLRFAFQSFRLYSKIDKCGKTIGSIIDYDTYKQIEDIKSSSLYKNGLFVENLCRHYSSKKRKYFYNKFVVCISIFYKLIKANRKL